LLRYLLLRNGFSVRDEPTAIETFAARRLRWLAIPSGAREAKNPIQFTPEVLADARGHFADHCATCHANDGSGETTMSRGMFPRVPDMRGARTQSLTDGELFSIIEHGIRLTGMPGWGDGTPEGERDSWGLVHFIRGLDTLSPEDLERMEGLNPKTAEEWREEEAARRFLAGEDSPTPAASPRGHDEERR
jgi:mono/diheme cytochrome c family protein